MLVAGLLAAAPAMAQSAEVSSAQQGTAMEFLEVIRADQAAEQMSSLVFQSFIEPIRKSAGADACPAAGKVIDDFSDKAGEFMRNAYRDGDYTQQLASLYQRSFSQSELEDAIAFFRSPTGQKFLDKQPELMQQGAALGQSLLVANSAKLEALTNQLRDDMTKAVAGCNSQKP